MKYLLNELYNESKFESCHYRLSDLKIDIKMVEKYKGRDFVFISRDYGSQVYPLCSGINPGWLTAYESYENAEWFHLSASSSTARKINSEEAVSLINRLPDLPSGREQLISSLETLLADPNVTSSGLANATIANSKPYNWSAWLDWFKSTKHTTMTKYMQKALTLNAM